MDGATVQAALQRLLDDQAQREHEYMREIVALREQVELLSQDNELLKLMNLEAQAQVQAFVPQLPQPGTTQEQASASQARDKAQMYRTKYYKYKLLYLGHTGLCRGCGGVLQLVQPVAATGAANARTPTRPTHAEPASPPASISPHLLTLPATPESQLLQSPTVPAHNAATAGCVPGLAGMEQQPSPETHHMGGQDALPEQRSPDGYAQRRTAAECAPGASYAPTHGSPVQRVLLYSPTRVKAPQGAPAVLQPPDERSRDSACVWSVPETLLPAFDGTVALLSAPVTVVPSPAHVQHQQEISPVHAQQSRGCEPAQSLQPAAKDQPVPAALGHSTAGILQHAAVNDLPSGPATSSLVGTTHNAGVPAPRPNASKEVAASEQCVPQSSRPTTAHADESDQLQSAPQQAGSAPQRPHSAEPPPVIVLDFSPIAKSPAPAVAAMCAAARPGQATATRVPPPTTDTASPSQPINPPAPSCKAADQQLMDAGAAHHALCSTAVVGTDDHRRSLSVTVTGHKMKKQRPMSPSGTSSSPQQQGMQKRQTPSGAGTGSPPQSSPSGHHRPVGSHVLRADDLKSFRSRPARAPAQHPGAAALPQWQSSILRYKGFKKPPGSCGSSDSGGSAAAEEQQVSKRARVHTWQGASQGRSMHSSQKHVEQQNQAQQGPPVAASAATVDRVHREASAHVPDSDQDMGSAPPSTGKAKQAVSPRSEVQRYKPRTILGDRTAQQVSSPSHPSPRATAKQQARHGTTGQPGGPPPGFKTKRKVVATGDGDDLAAVPQPLGTSKRPATCAVEPVPVQAPAAPPAGRSLDTATDKEVPGTAPAVKAPVTIPCVVRRPEVAAASTTTVRPANNGPDREHADSKGGVRPVKYTEVVRGKGRADLQGYECQQCRDFYNAMVSWQRPGTSTDPGLRPQCGHAAPSARHDAATPVGTGAPSVQAAAMHSELIQHNSRHRAQWLPPPGTPDGFWSLTFPEQPCANASPF